MPILYIYDISAKEKKEFNRVKRRFYYWLNQIITEKECWKTKSVILASRKHTRALDALFHEFSGSVIAYKANIRTIEELE